MVVVAGKRGGHFPRQAPHSGTLENFICKVLLPAGRLECLESTQRQERLRLVCLIETLLKTPNFTGSRSPISTKLRISGILL